MSWESDLICDSGPEAELLFRVSRTKLDEENCAAINQVLEKETIDWHVFLASVEKNYVAPLVYRSLTSLETPNVPRKVIETLRVRTRITSWKNEEFVAELLSLQCMFAEQNIEILNYKGPSAAIELYGDISGRTFNDIDFLVRKRDLDRTLELLERHGYKNKETLTQEEAELFVKEQKEYLLTRNHIQLEPHWSLAARRYPFEIDYEGLWSRANRLHYRDTELLVFCPEDSLHILALVAAKGKWQRLQQLTDIAECLRTYPNLDWNRVVSEAKSCGSERILLLALTLSEVLSGAQVPRSLLLRARASGSIRKLAESIAQSFIQPATTRRFLYNDARTFSPLLFSMRERWRDKARYVYRTTTTPTQLHTRRMPLPRRLFFLYRILVPVHDYLIMPAVAFARTLTRRQIDD